MTIWEEPRHGPISREDTAVLGDRFHYLVDQFGGRLDLRSAVPINYLADGASDHRVGAGGDWLLTRIVLL